MDDALTGRCLCGTVSWQYSGALTPLAHCHCGVCRKSHGTAFATYMAGDAGALTILRGGDSIRTYQSSPGFRRRFCDQCGSVTPGLAGDGHAFMPVANLDQGAHRLVAKIHIFVAHKADWYTIADDLRQFDAFPKASGPPTLAHANTVHADRCVGGSCACGAVAFEVDAPLERAQYCHCSRCQKARSGAFASNGFTGIENIHFTRGQTHLRSFKLPEARYFTQTFCNTCGALMPRLDPERGIAVIPFGSFDTSPALKPTRHIHLNSKLPWI
jgi:hypothetical protein